MKDIFYFLSCQLARTSNISDSIQVCHMDKHWKKMSVVIGSLVVENSLLPDSQGMGLFFQQRCRNGIASQHLLGPQVIQQNKRHLRAGSARPSLSPLSPSF